MKVLGDRIAVKRIVQDKTKGGLHLPDSVKDNVKGLPSIRCQVIALGEGRFTDTHGLVPLTGIEVGDIVHCHPLMTEIEVNGDKIVLIPINGVLLVE